MQFNGFKQRAQVLPLRSAAFRSAHASGFKCSCETRRSSSFTRSALSPSVQISSSRTPLRGFAPLPSLGSLSFVWPVWRALALSPPHGGSWLAWGRKTTVSSLELAANSASSRMPRRGTQFPLHETVVNLQPRSQGLSSYRPMKRTSRDERPWERGWLTWYNKQLEFARSIFFIHLLLKNCLTTITLEIESAALTSNAILVFKKFGLRFRSLCSQDLWLCRFWLANARWCKLLPTRQVRIPVKEGHWTCQPMLITILPSDLIYDNSQTLYESLARLSNPTTQALHWTEQNWKHPEAYSCTHIANAKSGKAVCE